MKVSYYPGCSLESTGKPYDRSARAVCGALGVELAEVEDWICCGSSAGLKTSKLVSTSLSAQNLALLEQAEPNDVLAPCPFCWRRLATAQQELRDDPRLKAEVQEVIDAQLAGDLEIHNLVEFVRRKIGLDAVRAKVARPLAGLKVVPYYGCFMTKPRQVTGCENPEDPTSMDEILAALGAEVLRWDFKTECCGAGLSLSKTERVEELTGRIAREAIFRGADAIVVACQLCQANLDMRQGEAARAAGESWSIPILYFTELMGLAFGVPPAALGLHHHVVDAMALLETKRLVG